jgi:hypothetical protein
MATRVTRAARHQLSLGTRLIAGATYVLILFILALWAHDGWPPASSSGLSFYSAAIAVLLAVFVSEPFYTSPKAALANSAALIVITTTVSREGLQASKHAVANGRSVLIWTRADFPQLRSSSQKTKIPDLQAFQKWS